MGLADRLAKASGLDSPKAHLRVPPPGGERESSRESAAGGRPPAPVAPAATPQPSARKPTPAGGGSKQAEPTLSPVEQMKKDATEKLLKRLGSRMNDSSITDEELSSYVRAELSGILDASSVVLSPEEKKRMLRDIEDDALGLGPLQGLLEDEAVTEIMVNGPSRIYIEKNGRLQLSEKTFTSEAQLRKVIDRIVTKVGRRVDESSPMVDARLQDGSRVNAIIPPLAPHGSALTIRKFSADPLRVDDLIRFGSFTPEIAEVLRAAVEAKLNIIVSGGTGTGKALTHATLIPTPRGLTTMGEIAVGEQVFDHHGAVGTVVGKFPQGRKRVYEVEFSTGEVVRADAEHNWWVADFTARRTLGESPPCSVKTTREMLEEGVAVPAGEAKQGRSFRFQTPVLEQAVHYERDVEAHLGLLPEELPIHPYVMGLWYGAGEAHRPYLCGLPEDLEAYNKTFAELGIPYNIALEPGRGRLTTPMDFTAALRAMGTGEKVPGGNKRPYAPYKYASEEARRLMLAGLIASDGSTNGTGSFTNTDIDLVYFARDIAASLGYLTSVGHCKQTPTCDPKGEVVEKKPFASVTISADDQLALLPRKKEAHGEGRKARARSGRSDWRAVVAIRPTEDFEEMSCIQVDTRDSTYLVGESFLTTHNTTLLNVLSSFIPEDDRIVTIEDAIELTLQQDHVVQLETRPPNVEGKGEVTIRDLVKNSLRMRPDRLVVGECRGGEALDLLSALNTGHDGSMSTIHSNSPRDCLSRFETLVLMAGVDLPLRAIRDQVASAVDLIVQIQRLRDGTRRITHITEVVGMEGDMVTTQDIFLFDFEAGVDETRRFRGVQKPTGIRPKFSDKLTDQGIYLDPAVFDRA